MEGIEQTITKVSGIADSIAIAVEQQGVATAEIARNVAETAEATSQMTDLITEVSVEARETSRHASDVRDNSAGLNAAVEGLRRSVIQVVRTATPEVNWRSLRRFEVDFPCRLTIGGQVHIARIADLSDAGALVRDGPLLERGDHGTIEIDRVGFELPIVVQGSENGMLRLEFVLDDLTATRFRGTPERLASLHAA